MEAKIEETSNAVPIPQSQKWNRIITKVIAPPDSGVIFTKEIILLIVDKGKFLRLFKIDKKRV
jgi:hypothetical protein